MKNEQLIALRACGCRKKAEEMIVVFVFVVQCLTQHTPVGWLFHGFVLVVLASRVRPVPFRSR